MSGSRKAQQSCRALLKDVCLLQTLPLLSGSGMPCRSSMQALRCMP